jgi:hypothetical protein
MGILIETPLAIGELIDKITILEIKVQRLCDPQKIKNVEVELSLLCKKRSAAVPVSPKLDELAAQLKSVNEQIWDLEDAIRECERKDDFATKFIEIARSIYRTNDERAAIKRQINIECDSELIEEKSYAAY